MGTKQTGKIAHAVRDTGTRRSSASRNVAGFDFQGRNRQFLAAIAQGPTNEATGYDVQIVPAVVAPGQRYWQVIGVYHLQPQENGRRHNAFIEALDETGNRLQHPALRVGWIWAGKSDGPAEPKRLDKPTNEPAADIPLEKTMTVTLWIESDEPSDQVRGLHTRHADEPGGEGSGNTWGHHSYYIVFHRTRKQAPVDGTTTILTKPVTDGSEPTEPDVVETGDPVDTGSDTTETVTAVQDNAAYVAGSDFIKDGTPLPPGQPFAQSWEFSNTGTTTWGPGYKLIWVGGERLGAPPVLAAPACIPGQRVRLAVPYVAPQQPGLYISTWRLCNAADQPFGEQVWAQIEVPATKRTRQRK